MAMGEGARKSLIEHFHELTGDIYKEHIVSVKAPVKTQNTLAITFDDRPRIIFFYKSETVWSIETMKCAEERSKK